ncbi:MAG: molybdenum cofactor guanylyltransferase [Prolixibacteraceae bacterium]|nr:molybdenum cofactor guanylyltransferase [Prolixibacteraceae bacterium]
MLENLNISGYILAGGKSSRMGTDKALLMFQNEPLLKHMIKLIEPFCNCVSISGQNANYSVFGAEIVPDLFSDCGPIAGIYSTLCHSKSEWNLLVSVDVPFVNDELLHYLISSTGDYDCIVPKHDLGVEPLIGLYHKRVIPIIEDMIKGGDYKLMNLVQKLNTRFLDCNSLIKSNSRLFMNINHPKDYQSI